MNSANRPTSKDGGLETYNTRRWIDRVNGVPTRRRMWKGRTPHPFHEADGMKLKPINASQEKGFRPPKRKRGRKVRQPQRK